MSLTEAIAKYRQANAAFADDDAAGTLLDAAHEGLCRWQEPATDDGDILEALRVLKEDGAGDHSEVAGAMLNLAIAHFERKAPGAK